MTLPSGIRFALLLPLWLLLFPYESMAGPKSDSLSDSPDFLSVQQVRGGKQVGKRTRVKGVVTYSFLGSKDFFVQDATGGIYVETGGRLKDRLSVGQSIQIEGVVSAGDTPKIILDKVTVTGREELPSAHSISYEQVINGKADGERIEIAGTIRSATIQNDSFHGKNLILIVLTAGGQFNVRCPEVSDDLIQNWLNVAIQQSWANSAIRVKGVAGGMVNQQHQLIDLIVYVPRLSDIQIENIPPTDPSLVPERAIGSLLRIPRNEDVGHRVKVMGAVLYSDPGKMLFIRDDTGTLQVFSNQSEPVNPGDIVEVIGVPGAGDYSAVLENAIFKKISSGPVLPGLRVDPDEILHGKLDCKLVTTRGTVVDFIRDSDKGGLWLKAGNTLFNVYWNATSKSSMVDRAEKGSVVEVTGIPLVKRSGVNALPQTFHLLLPSASAVTILKTAPWWTLGRLLWAIGALGIAILLSWGWVGVLSKKNRLLEHEVLRRQRVEEQLQLAHNELEQRMEGRTAELYDQINRREKVEAEFQAILRERTRIAQELHDTLQQGLVGIALQLDTAAEVILEKPELAQNHLELARRMMRHSQAETRRSVWDLRSQSLEQGGLVAALRLVVRQLSEGTPITMDFSSNKENMVLPVLVEDNLYRIGQEALTNAIKHARATKIAVSVELRTGLVVFKVSDNGVGFDEKNLVANGQHFGLQGIRERVKRLGGELTLESRANEGTLVCVTVPIQPAAIDSGVDDVSRDGRLSEKHFSSVP